MTRNQKSGMRKKTHPNPAAQGPAWVTTAGVARVASMSVSLVRAALRIQAVDPSSSSRGIRESARRRHFALLPGEQCRAAPLLPAGRHEPRLVRDDDEVHAVARVQLRHDARDVRLRGERAQHEPLRRSRRS